VPRQAACRGTSGTQHISILPEAATAVTAALGPWAMLLSAIPDVQVNLLYFTGPGGGGGVMLCGLSLGQGRSTVPPLLTAAGPCVLLRAHVTS
jgi:hypothetical protein